MQFKSIFKSFILFILTIALSGCGGGSANNITNNNKDISPVLNSLGMGPGKFVYVANAGSNNIVLLNVQSTDAPLVNSSATEFSPYTTSQISPISLAIDADYDHLYASGSGVTGFIDVFTINKATGELTFTTGISLAQESLGSSLTLDPTGTILYVANFNSKSVSVYRVNRSTGALTEAAGSPYDVGSQAVSAAVNPITGCLYVVTVNNGIHVFSVNRTTGSIKNIIGSPFAVGSGLAGKITFNRSGTYSYISGGNSAVVNDIAVFSINENSGAMVQIPGSPYHSGTYSVAVTLDPANRFAYVPNQLSNSVSVYSVNSNTGALSEISGSPFPTGAYPTSVTIDPTGSYAYVSTIHPTNTIEVFSIDSATGALKALPDYQISKQLYSPVGMIFY